MSERSSKYDKTIKLIRESKPVLLHPGLIENSVIERIRSKERSGSGIAAIIELVYGWIYIGWIRRSFVGAALFVFLVFVYQQADLIRSVRSIEREVVSIQDGQKTANIRDLERRLTVLRVSSGISKGRKIEVDESQLQELIDSYKSIELKYENLRRIILEDSNLREYVENKLREEEKNRSKI